MLHVGGNLAVTERGGAGSARAGWGGVGGLLYAHTYVFGRNSSLAAQTDMIGGRPFLHQRASTPYSTSCEIG